MRFVKYYYVININKITGTGVDKILREVLRQTARTKRLFGLLKVDGEDNIKVYLI